MTRLALALFSVVLASTRTQAQDLFSTTFTSGDTPAGYTQTATTGTITYANNQMIVGDMSVNGAAAYIQSTTNPVPNCASISTQLTFTPTFNTTSDTSGTAADVTIFRLNTSGGNNALFSVDFAVSGYNNNDQINVGSGFQFGGGTFSGTNNISSAGINSLSGHMLTVNDTEHLTPVVWIRSLMQATLLPAVARFSTTLQESH